MKLDYKILWFEDRPDDIAEAIVGIERSVRKQGFRLKIDSERKISQDEIEALSLRLRDYCDYDLIVCDYDMGDSIDGAQIASKLREQIRREMVFYSGKTLPELRKILFEAQVDGVFPVHRTDLKEDLTILIEDHIKKTCDLNNMRGIVIDEICKVERLMRDVIGYRIESLDAMGKSSVLKKMKDKIIERGECVINNVSECVCPISLVGEPRMSDFNMIRSRLMKLANSDVLKDLLKENGDIHRMQDLRNQMAHVEASLDADKGVMMFKSGGNLEFSYDVFMGIRLQLLSIGDALGAEILDDSPAEL